MQPFLGIYRNENGEYVDIASGQIVTLDQIKPPMKPFNGMFMDKDGNLHNISEYIGGSSGGGIAKELDPIYTADKPYIALKSEIAWIRIDSPTNLTSTQNSDGSFDFNGFHFADAPALWSYMAHKHFNCNVIITLTQVIEADRVLSCVEIGRDYYLQLQYNNPAHSSGARNIYYMNIFGNLRIGGTVPKGGGGITLNFQNCENVTIIGNLGSGTGQRIDSFNVTTSNVAVSSGTSTKAYISSMNIYPNSSVMISNGLTNVTQIQNHGIVIIDASAQYTPPTLLTQFGMTIDNRTNNDRDTFLRKNQGSANSGKLLSVGSDGAVILIDNPVGTFLGGAF